MSRSFGHTDKGPLAGGGELGTLTMGPRNRLGKLRLMEIRRT